MKKFTDADVFHPDDSYPRIHANNPELVYAPLPWQTNGLQETASGYGHKLTSPFKISFNGKLYRIYITQISNAGTSWFTVRGRKIVVD